MRKVTSPELGARIRAIRDKLNYQQKDFAASLGMAASHLSEIEQGRIKPGYDILSRLLSQFPINPYYIFRGEKPMVIENRNELQWKTDGDFGVLNQEVERMLWYMSHIKVMRLDMLSHFEQSLEQFEILIQKQLKRHGLSYPGDEE